jgi:hypothetical protein
MVGQILLNLAASAAGGVVGLIEKSSANKLEARKIDAEAERDKEMARQKQIKDFYDTLDRHDNPKKTTSEKNILWGLLRWKTSKYVFTSIPARRDRSIGAWMLIASYSILILWCGFGADIPIQSFPADPATSKWFEFFGFTLLTKTGTDVYQLTLGGLILALASPLSFAITKWLTGTDGNLR